MTQLPPLTYSSRALVDSPVDGSAGACSVSAEKIDRRARSAPTCAIVPSNVPPQIACAYRRAPYHTARTARAKRARPMTAPSHTCNRRKFTSIAVMCARTISQYTVLLTARRAVIPRCVVCRHMGGLLYDRHFLETTGAPTDPTSSPRIAHFRLDSVDICSTILSHNHPASHAASDLRAPVLRCVSQDALDHCDNLVILQFRTALRTHHFSEIT